jgi:hypothetical protein
MSEPDDFDALLKERFDREHQHVPAELFIAATTRRMRAESRYAQGVRTAMRVAALVAAVLASPWLIAGAARLNAALESSFAWTAGLPGTWVLGVLVAAAVLWSRVRSR